jgi:uncharacterized protein YdeI (YjbR/CyaY-like superfamily)
VSAGGGKSWRQIWAFLTVSSGVKSAIMNRIPKDFPDALEQSGLNKFFADYAPSHRREYLKWIAEAKRPETREKRIQKAMKMLSDTRAEAAARAKKRG